MCINLYPVQNCPALANISHAQLSTLQTEFSTMVTVTCSYGYQFVDCNQTTVEVECVDGGMWNASFSSCQGQCRTVLNRQYISQSQSVSLQT